MNTHVVKLKISLADWLRLVLSSGLAAFTSTEVTAADGLEQSNPLFWLYNIPSWMPSVLLIGALMGLFWLGFALLRRWFPVRYGERNDRTGYYAVAVGALVGILLVPFVTNLWKNYLSESINYLPFTAAGITPLPMPNSQISYPGASATNAFVAREPYVVNIQGTMVTVSLWGSSRGNDFSGNMPFVNAATGHTDPAQIQAWNPVFAATFSPILSGDYNLNDDTITNTGFPGRVDKETINGTPVTMVRYNAGDGTTQGHPRSQLLSYPVPPRTHVRWDLNVAFGNADGINNWTLNATGQTPVLFWQLYSMNQSNPPLAANVDTDSNDPTKLMITFFQRVGTATQPTQIGVVNGLSPNTMVSIVIEAFLDERPTANGGQGLLQISVNNTMAVQLAGPNLSTGTNTHWWDMAMYSWNENASSPYTRASFWQTARMIVFPVVVADTIPPSAPANLVGTPPNSTSANLSWSASTDNVGVAGYNIFRNGTQIGSSATTSFTDAAVVAGTSYNYTVTAYDAAGNQSTASNTATVTVPVVQVNISSFYVASVASTYAIINWTTNIPASGVVYYGTNSSNLTSKVTVNSQFTSSSTPIMGLTKLTKYYYKITANSGTSTAVTSVSSFTTTK